VAIGAAIETLKSTTQLTQVRFVLFDANTLRTFITAAEKLRNPKTSSPYKLEKSPS
jgi:hypothetical protein